MNKYIKERYRIMRNLIKSDEDKVILDIGAGKEAISDGLIYKKRIKIDGDKEKEPDILTDLNKGIPLESQSIDIVIMGEIIEHLINPFRFILEVKRVLKQNGTLILSTPNIASLKNRIKLLFGKMPSNNSIAYPSLEEHLFYHKSDWTLKWIIGFLENGGFKIDKKLSNGILIKNKLILKGEICPPTLGEILILRGIKK